MTLRDDMIEACDRGALHVNGVQVQAIVKLDCDGTRTVEASSLRCFDCGGPAHPAVGCQYTETMITCARCTAKFWIWMLAFIAGKGRRKGPAFYDHVKGPGA